MLGYLEPDVTGNRLRLRKQDLAAGAASTEDGRLMASTEAVSPIFKTASRKFFERHEAGKAFGCSVRCR
jgi:hypothetical protein